MREKKKLFLILFLFSFLLFLVQPINVSDLSEHLSYIKTQNEGKI